VDRISAIERAWLRWNRAAESQAALVSACRYPAKQPDPVLFARAKDDAAQLYDLEKTRPSHAVELTCAQRPIILGRSVPALGLLRADRD
jgi:hypothetical protein